MKSKEKFRLPPRIPMVEGVVKDHAGNLVWTRKDHANRFIQWRGQICVYPVSKWERLHFEDTVIYDADGKQIRVIKNK